VVKLADTQDLGSCALRRGGSSPPSRTNLESAASSLPKKLRTFCYIPHSRVPWRYTPKLTIHC